MTDYSAPTTEIGHVLRDLASIGKLAELPGFEDVSDDLIDAVLDECGKLASNVVAPLNVSGDREGTRVEDGQVVEASGFKDAYWQYVEGGWNSLPFEPAYGGQGLPTVLAFAVQEMMQSANVAFSLCPLLNQGAIDALTQHADETLKERYLPKMISGEWTGTMNLTEPQAGSDLSVVRTRAERDGDRYRLFGTKIYITWGDHGMTDNVVHLVLARLPDAPPGVKGISLFLVPKYLHNGDGSLGERNDVYPVSVEHKLGIHASPTCVMSFGENDGAIGYLVGAENNGLACMFTMMNHARLSVGLQGVAVSERALQLAAAYARDRVQGGKTIVHHPDVRRMLMEMKAQTEAGRALAYAAMSCMDIVHHSPDEDQRRLHEQRAALLTPIVKGWCTELAMDVTSLGVQIHGGMGFVEETGAAQHMRDARILPIYEGTNGIQAMDLVGRKFLRDGGEGVRHLLDDIRTTALALQQHDGQLSGIGERLDRGVATFERAGQWILEHPDGDEPGAAAFNFMRLAGVVCGAWQLGRAALAAREHLDADRGDPAFWQAKLVTARFFAEHILPRADAALQAIEAGSESVMALGEDQF
jgi:alkylation response protein AidB-like acyl-CoA dehydrogenase